MIAGTRLCDQAHTWLASPGRRMPPMPAWVEMGTTRDTQEKFIIEQRKLAYFKHCVSRCAPQHIIQRAVLSSALPSQKPVFSFQSDDGATCRVPHLPSHTFAFVTRRDRIKRLQARLSIHKTVLHCACPGPLKSPFGRRWKALTPTIWQCLTVTHTLTISASKLVHIVHLISNLST